MNGQDNSTTPSLISFEKLVARHKNIVAHNFAFTLNKSLVDDVRRNVYMKPPRRCEDKELKETMSTAACSEIEEEPPSLTFTESTASRLGAQPSQPEPLPASNIRLAAVTENQHKLLNKLMPIITTYEDFLLLNQHADSKRIGEVQRYNRGLVNYILLHQETFTNIPRESLALVTILLNAESINLNKNILLHFIGDTLHIQKFTKISQIRKSRGYTLLSNLVRLQATSGMAQACN